MNQYSLAKVQLNFLKNRIRAVQCMRFLYMGKTITTTMPRS